MSHQKDISKFQFITGESSIEEFEVLINRVSAAGVNWVQLRVKNMLETNWKQYAKEAKAICESYNITFIVNDNVSIAKEIGADGVHLGKLDMPPKYAREILGPDAIIGGTANTMDDVKYLAEAKVDYIGLGPYKFTITKEVLSPILGMEGYKDIIKKCKIEGINIPIIAIGGIKVEDIVGLRQLGVYGIAVSSAIEESNDVEGTINRFLWHIDSEVSI